MDIIDAINTRRSIRRFSDQRVEDGKLQALIEAVRMAPSWANYQCWRLVVVTDNDVKEQISAYSYVESFFAAKGYKSNPSMKALAQAPVVIVLCADPEKSGVLWNQQYYLVDSGIAAENLMLTARGLGLGSVFVGVYDENKIKSLLKIPDAIRIIGLFPIGYPAEDKKTGPARMAAGEFCFYGEWGKKA
ncbi:MAG TPA: nitroreductase family protein [Nitrospirota bacterium]|nr:nitroreductase family protein [Nitrospirota bacterium]